MKRWPTATALHYAAQLNDFPMVLSLLKAGADCTIEDNQGRKPIHLATERKVIKLLEGNLIYSSIDKI